MSRRLVLGACVAILATAGSARAQQEAPEPLGVAYEAPEGCPSSDAFFREITARTTRARAAQSNERARIMHVIVTKGGEEHTGRLWIDDANASSTARSVSGKTCGEVVGALALIGALAVDPRASTAPIAAAPASTDVSVREPSLPAEKAADGPVGAREPAAGDRDRDRVAASPSSSPPVRPRGRIEVGAQAEIAVVAGVVPSGRVFGDLSVGPRAGLFAPALRLAIARSLDVDRSAAIGGATLRWTSAGLDLCPLRLALARPLALRPCAGGSAGVLEASGTGIAGPVARSRPWATLSVLARLVWEPVAWLDVDVEAGAIAPLYRESFIFTPSVAVYEAPAVAFLSRVGVGLRFP